MIPLEYQIAVHQYDAAVSDWIAGGQKMTDRLAARILYWRKIVHNAWMIDDKDVSSTDSALDISGEVC